MGGVWGGLCDEVWGVHGVVRQHAQDQHSLCACAPVLLGAPIDRGLERSREPSSQMAASGRVRVRGLRAVG